MVAPVDDNRRHAAAAATNTAVLVLDVGFHVVGRSCRHHCVQGSLAVRAGQAALDRCSRLDPRSVEDQSNMQQDLEH